MAGFEFAVRLGAMVIAGAIAFAPRRVFPLFLGSRGRDFPGHYLGVVHWIAIAVFVGLAAQIVMLFN